MIFNSALQPFNDCILSPFQWLLGKISKTYFVHIPLCTVKFSYCTVHIVKLCYVMFVFTGVSIRYILFSVFADSRYLKCIEISILSIENTESSISISSGY